MAVHYCASIRPKISDRRWPTKRMLHQLAGLQRQGKRVDAVILSRMLLGSTSINATFVVCVVYVCTTQASNIEPRRENRDREVNGCETNESQFVLDYLSSSPYSVLYLSSCRYSLSSIGKVLNPADYRDSRIGLVHSEAADQSESMEKQTSDVQFPAMIFQSAKCSLHRTSPE